ncbi:hypothetical protein A6A04_06060 [Paramagnetospirillum marisnigri]|uniref:histidine kinase n=1 Tax=Paramagnetospirillum marisnigri TaxID=1285242 RepID=A0A178MF56_9PROT|nr:ATP-binding protein [Paramagnetospirillum marisnigri]OAN46777.1 hypothetical protein A6A04_06060 [Paramagnetospirillum marisnigri]
MTEDTSFLQRFDDGASARLALPIGGLLVVVAWVGVWWDMNAAWSFIVGALSHFPGLGEWGQVAVAVLVVGGMAAMGLSWIAMQRRLTRLAAELRARDTELDETRSRLRRHVADLERVAEVASHDLQEPLRRLVAYAQLLESHQRGEGDDEARLYLTHVMDSARRMTALISGLRAFVAVDSHQPSGEITSAKDAMMTARKRLSGVLTAADAALVVDPLPEVSADRAALVEVFLQLIDNAVRFRAPERRPIVRVSAHREGRMVRFEIRDNGIGIDPARVARMFEIFYRPHDARNSSVAGIGMGLAVVRRLVERLGGDVWVSSELGKGSCFGFSLPAVIEDENTDQEAMAA